MGVSVLLKDASFTQGITSLTVGNRDKLVGEFFFGGTELDTITNRAGDLDLKVLGEPVYSQGFVTCSGGGFGDNRFDTEIFPPEFGDVTVIAVMRNNNGNLNGNVCQSTGFTGIRDSSGRTAFFNGQTGTPANAADVSPINQGDWTMIAGAGSLGELGEAHIWKGSVRETGVAEDAGTSSRQQNPYEIFNASVSDVDIAYLAIFDRKLEAVELDTIYAGVKAFISTRGVVMV